MTHTTITLKDGNRWTGYVDDNGVRNGFGIKTYPNGARYVGEYVDNVRHGAGVKIHADGTKVMCVYEHGKKVK